MIVVDNVDAYLHRRTMDDVAASLGRGRWVSPREADLHDAIAGHLAHEHQVDREVWLWDGDVMLGRLDLLVGRVGVEVKVGGSRAHALEQAQRYLRSPHVDSLVLASTRGAVVRDWPETLAGKPTVGLWLRSL